MMKKCDLKYIEVENIKLSGLVGCNIESCINEAMVMSIANQVNVELHFNGQCISISYQKLRDSCKF